MTKFIGVTIILYQLIYVARLKEIPEYIQICKRDQTTIDECVRKSIERLRPKLAEGIPELKVPPIEPFYISELVVESGNLVPFQAVGKDVKVSGAGNFSIKSVSVDLDTLTIRARVRIPKLHFDGRYLLDARLLMLPLHGQGNIVADALKCEAEILMLSELVQRDGVEYIHFTSLDVKLNVKDYNLRIDGLFDGNKALGDAANEAVNQSRGEFLRAIKPYAEKTVSKLFLESANNIASTYPLDQLLPKS